MVNIAGITWIKSKAVCVDKARSSIAVIGKNRVRTIGRLFVSIEL